MFDRVKLTFPLGFVAGGSVIKVLVLRKILNTKPQQFLLVLKDFEKVQQTKYGTEDEIRTILKKGGRSYSEIDELIEHAKSEDNRPK